MKFEAVKGGTLRTFRKIEGGVLAVESWTGLPD